jgi:NAD(P)-dependent dehydrogenase (short-subunit alcohol dehydrogenase family)
VLLNAVAPGVVRTPMTQGLLEDPHMSEIIGQMHPMGVEGYAEPDEIAELAAYLLCFEGHYLLGQVMFIDGGVDAITRPEAL